MTYISRISDFSVEHVTFPLISLYGYNILEADNDKETIQNISYQMIFNSLKILEYVRFCIYIFLNLFSHLVFKNFSYYIGPFLS